MCICVVILLLRIEPRNCPVTYENMKEYCEHSLSVLRHSFVLVHWNSSCVALKLVHQRLCYKRAPKHMQELEYCIHIFVNYIYVIYTDMQIQQTVSVSAVTVVCLKFFPFHEDNRICAWFPYILIYILWERIFKNSYFLHEKNGQIISLPSIYFVPLLELWLNGKIKWDLSRWLSTNQWQRTML